MAHSNQTFFFFLNVERVSDQINTLDRLRLFFFINGKRVWVHYTYTQIKFFVARQLISHKPCIGYKHYQKSQVIPTDLIHGDYKLNADYPQISASISQNLNVLYKYSLAIQVIDSS